LVIKRNYDGKDINWLKASIAKYYRIMIFFLLIPWILLVFSVITLPLFIPTDYSNIMIRIFSILITIFLVAGMFLYLIWIKAVKSIEQNIDLVTELITTSNNKISIKDYSPFGDYSSNVNRTIIFSSPGNKYPKLFYLEFKEQLDIFDRIFIYPKGYKLRNPCLCIEIPFNQSPRINIYNQEVKIDDEEIKKKVQDVIKDPILPSYIISKQHLSGFGGIPKENRLVAGFLENNFIIDDLLETLQILNQIFKVTYGGEKINSKSFSTFNRYLGGPYDCMQIFYCPNCKTVINIRDFSWGKNTKETCSLCGGKLQRGIQRWNQ
jgi:hypothetical protein